MRLTRSTLVLTAVLALASCARLPRSLRDDISAENGRMHEAQRQILRSQDQVHDDLAKAPDLFRNAAVAAEWDATLRAAREKLANAQSDNTELNELARRNRADSQSHVEQLLNRERDLRLSAVEAAQSVESAANKWVDIARDPSFYLGKLNHERDEIRNVDFGPVEKTVHQAEQDWPAKKTELDSRLAALREIPKSDEAQWTATENARRDAASGKLTSGDVATLIQEEDALSRDASSLPRKADELRDQCSQLYNAWDKILVDLDASRENGHEVYREEIKTVRTHFIDVPAKKTETKSDQQWVNVSEPAFHAVQNDLGMSIAHKDAGVFDSEAQTTPQPAGFAYVASPSEGSNQYGYWTHNGGESFWTFFPEYLLLRELMWGHDYRPIVIGEYNGYRTAERMGRTYYGQETPTSAPKYGTHGTFTQTHYAQSRYLQSGGFRGSAYAGQHGNGSLPNLNASRSEEPRGFGMGSRTGGRRFGSPPGSQGKQFGGFRGGGRRFGGRRR